MKCSQKTCNDFTDPKYQNKGYGREAGVNLMLYGLENLGMPGYGVTIHPDNKPSLKVATTEGYVKAGETTLETVRGTEPRLVLILSKEEFFHQRTKDKVSYFLPKKEPQKKSWFCSKKNEPK